MSTAHHRSAANAWTRDALPWSTRTCAIRSSIWLPPLSTVSTCIPSTSRPTNALHSTAHCSTSEWAPHFISWCSCATSCAPFRILCTLSHLLCWWEKAPGCYWVSTWKWAGWEFVREDLGERWEWGSVQGTWVEYVSCCSSEVLWRCKGRLVAKGECLVIHFWWFHFLLQLCCYHAFAAHTVSLSLPITVFFVLCICFLDTLYCYGYLIQPRGTKLIL